MRILLLLAFIFLSVAMIAQKTFHMAVPPEPEVNINEEPIEGAQVIAVQDSNVTILDSLPMMEMALSELSIRGKVYSALITEEGDTLIMDVFSDISITSMRSFDDDADYQKYLKQRRYASIVYPYAREAIRIFREVEWAEVNLKKRDRKKRIKKLEKELKSEFEAPLSKLTKLQGKIMIKMIEQELDYTMHNLIKSVRGRFTAFYWHISVSSIVMISKKDIIRAITLYLMQYYQILTYHFVFRVKKILSILKRRNSIISL